MAAPMPSTIATMPRIRPVSLPGMSRGLSWSLRLSLRLSLSPRRSLVETSRSCGETTASVRSIDAVPHNLSEWVRHAPAAETGAVPRTPSPHPRRAQRAAGSPPRSGNAARRRRARSRRSGPRPRRPCRRLRAAAAALPPARCGDPGRAAPAPATASRHDAAVRAVGRVRRLPASSVEERLQQVERQREDDRRVLVRPHLEQRLEVAQVERGGLPADDRRRSGQLLRGLELALGVDDLRPALALGLGLARHRSLHRLRYLDVLDLDRRHLDAPGLRLVVDDLLEIVVQAVALGEQLVELGAAEHRA